MMGFSCLVPRKIDSQLERSCIHMHACALVFETLREYVNINNISTKILSIFFQENVIRYHIWVNIH